MYDVCKKIKAIVNELDGCYVDYTVEDAINITNGIIAQGTKVNSSTGKKLVFTGYLDGNITCSVIDAKPTVNEWLEDKGL